MPRKMIKMKSVGEVKARIRVGPKRVFLEVELNERVANILRRRLEKQHGLKPIRKRPSPR